jgi:hypothetical protein
MRDQEIGRAQAPPKIREEVEYPDLQDEVEIGDGLVEDDEAGIRGQRPRDAHALELPAAHPARQLPGILRRQPHQAEKLGDAGGAARPVQPGEVAQRLRHDPPDGMARVHGAGRVLEHRLDAAPERPVRRRRRRGQGMSPEQHPAGAGRLQPQEQPRERALAGAAFPQEADRLALPDGDVHAVQDAPCRPARKGRGAVGHADAFGRQQGHGRASSE